MVKLYYFDEINILLFTISTPLRSRLIFAQLAASKSKIIYVLITPTHPHIHTHTDVFTHIGRDKGVRVG